MIQERLGKLREAMEERGIDCYLIPTSDYHDSEYVSGFFRVREFFSGFTGSAGTLVVSRREAALFTDGRYFIQAEKQLSGTGIRLMRIGEPDVPSLKDYLEQTLQEGECLGFDGRVVKAQNAAQYEEILEKKRGRLIWDQDLAQEIWQERPRLVHQPVYVLEERFSGESTASKIARLREKMKEEEATVHILTSLDDIAWLFNIRGNDVKCCPVVLAYAVITQEQALLFAREDEAGCPAQEALGGGDAPEGAARGDQPAGDASPAWSREVCSYLWENGITLLPYSDFYHYVSTLHGEKALLCLERVNCRLKKELARDVEIINKSNPTTLMKAVKNPVEMENLRRSHLKDGIAVTRFMYWLKKNVGKIPMTEISAAQELESFRRQQEGFIEPSFETICAFGANGAIVHYSATPQEYARIEPHGLLVVDSGGHYPEGSTDITRTFALGDLTGDMKKHFTLVLRAMLNLKTTRFLHGCRGLNLDVRAREVLWEHGLDYKHGTGHGVGYLLNVHEGPNGFRWKLVEHDENAQLEEGMVTTDEPGLYIEGSHGIRIENELLCRRGEENEYGQFMYFEDLTCVPVDLDAVELSLMTDTDRARLNAYHSEVFEKLSPYFEGEELAWLKEATRKV